MSRNTLQVALTVLLLAAVEVTSAAVVYEDVARLTARANQIVVGDVADIVSFWDTESGLIKSDIVVTVSDYLVGTGTGTEVLRLSGGTVDGITLQVSVLPVFEIGDHVLLFLRDGEARLVGSFQGAYLTDGQQIVRLAPACGTVIPESQEPLPEFLQRIAAALPPGEQLPELKPYEGGFVLPEAARYSLCGYDWTYKANPMGEDYVINANCVDASAGDAATQRAQIQNGPAAWNTAGADFEFTYGGTSTQTSVTSNGTNLVYFDTTPPDGGDYVAATYIWAGGGDISECDLVFNDRDYTWWNGSGSCGSNKMDIWNIATHEFGHMLCLADLYGGGDTAKTMYGYVSYCDIHARDLHSDDINGIIAIYGTGGPSNDSCSSPYVVTDGVYYGSTTLATNDGSASCGTSSSTPDVWYSYTAPATGTLTAHLCDSGNYDTVLSIHTGCPGTSANQLDCDDDDCPTSNRSTITVAVTSGTNYRIRVSGYDGATGDFTLTIIGPSDALPPTPNPMTFAVTPYPLSTSTITMTATTATDADSPPVAYFFDCVAGGAGASDSSWQALTVYSDYELAPNTSYTYQVKARDSAPTPNETGYSSTAGSATYIETPIGVSFGAVTASTIALQAEGTLTNLAVGSSGVYFDSTTSGGDGGINDWEQTITDTATGLNANTYYAFHVRARNQLAVQTSYSGESSECTAIQTPTGITFGTITTDSIVLYAGGTFTNLTLGSSGMYFDSTTAGGDGGLNAWVTTTTDTATGLAVNTQYTFQAKARNQKGIETGWGPSAARATYANTPSAPTLNNPTTSTMNVNVNPGSNPTYTEFAIRCTATADGTWLNRYVSATGQPTASPVWRTDGTWGTTTVQSLQANTQYTFAVVARNLDGVQTSFGAGASLTTLPLPTGACCYADGSCSVTEQAACSGTWQGSGTTCTPNPCPQPSGACCFPDGSCTYVTQANCSGTWQGMGTTCSPNPCPQPSGACCFPDGSCTYVTQANCSGTWQGMGTTCSPNPCPQPSGACCFPDGSCTYVTQASCSGTWQGMGTDCDPNPCPQPEGACCYTDGSCSVTEQAACAGDWQGMGTDCDPNPCPQPWCLGDMNCSGGSPTFEDIKYFSAAVGSESGWWAYYRAMNGGADPICPWLLGDYSTPRDGVEFTDIKPFAASIGQPCQTFVP